MIYSLSITAVSRKQGQSAVACAAYQSRSAVPYHRENRICDYASREGLVEEGIFGPTGWNRERLWNEVEDVAETRSDARLAERIRIALPSAAECDDATRMRMVQDYCYHIRSEYGFAVDYAIHRPSTQGDERNEHVHLLLTNRAVADSGEWAAKKDERWRGKRQMSETTEMLRAKWSEYVERHTGEYVDHRSHARLGLTVTPGSHLGPGRCRVLRAQGVRDLAAAARQRTVEIAQAVARTIGNTAAALHREIDEITRSIRIQKYHDRRTRDARRIDALTIRSAQRYRARQDSIRDRPIRI